MPAVLNHWVVATEVARKYIGASDHVALFQGSSDDRTQVAYRAQPFTDAPAMKEAAVSRYLYLGSTGPDVPYWYHVTFPRLAAKAVGFNPPKLGKSHVADLLHYNKPSEIIVEVVRRAKLLQGSDKVKADRLMAYALGHATHVAADSILHPYVNCFAGAYHQQVIPDIHMQSEVHQDSWLAQSYFGKEFVDEGQGWGNFLPPPVIPGEWASKGGTDPHPAMVSNPAVEQFFAEIAAAFEKTYGRGPAPGADYFVASYSNFYEKPVDLAYDTAFVIVPKEPHPSLVFHRILNGKGVYYQDLISKHAIPAAIDACKAVLDLYDAPSMSDAVIDTFRSKVKNWNLDMGYWLDIELVGNQLRIIWRHTWFGKSLSAKPHA